MTDASPSATPTSDNLLRLAAVQLAYVPNVRKNQGSYWLPDEPLLSLSYASATDAGGTALADLDHGEEFEGRTDEALNSSRRERLRSMELKVKQILEFCVQHRIDVVVFPECAIPAELVSILVGYRNRLVIFAGIGQLREPDASVLEQQGIADALDAVECNAAVFVSQERLALVTKRDPAQGETITPGRGPERVKFTKGERTYELGLAICMDYVNLRRDFDGGERPPDVVLVSALSRPTDDFLKCPRNFATVFANHADRGGSAILAPHVAGLFVDERLGTEPLPPGEAIASADFAGFPTRPSSTKPPQNRVHLRAAILYEDDGANTAETAGVLARPMQSWSLSHYTTGLYTEFLSTADRRLAEAGQNAVLLNAVKTLRRRQKQKLMSASDFATATTHLVLTQVQSEPELHYAALNKLHEHWHPLLEDPSIDGLGRLIDEVNRARRQLESRVRSRYQRVTPPTRPADGSAAGQQELTLFYSARLGRYSGEVAVRSLPRQLGVLRTLSLVNDASARLLYRVTTVRQTSGNLAPFFDVLALTESADPAVIEDLAEGVGQQLSVAFSGGWDISSTPGQADLDAPHLVELRPKAQNVPLVQEDWGGLIDYLRALKPQVTVQMTLRRVPEAERNFTARLPEGTGLFADEDRNAAAFFIRASQESSDPANLALQIHVASDERLGDSVLRSIGLWLFRGVPFDVVSDESALAALAPGGQMLQPGTPLTPAEALRIFHPPYGRIEGRGLVNQRPRTLSLPDITLPIDGINLGTARLAQAREDQRVVVRLDEGARRRHTYVVGRTGSGKTNILKHMARQDLQEGRSLVVIDPHGDLVDYLLGHTAGREDEVLFLDFGDPEYLPVLNPLDLDVHNKAELELAIEEFIQLLVRQSYHEFYGPRFEEIVRLALESITNEDYPFKPPGVIDLIRVLRSKDRRRWIKDLLTDSDLKERWAIFERQQDHEIAQVLHWALSKFSEMQQDGALGKVLAGGTSTVSIERVVTNGGVLLVKLPEWEMSRSAATLLGTFIQERVRKAVYARWRSDEGKSAPVYMYVDEFQSFAVTGFDELVAEARKFGLSLVLAHQNLSQLNAFSRFTGAVSNNLLSAILGNVANRIVFGVSGRDAKLLAEELDVSADILRTPGNYQAVVQMLHGGETHTFTLQPPNADSDSGLPVDRDSVRHRMLEQAYWRSRAELRAADEERESRSQAAVREHLNRAKTAFSPPSARRSAAPASGTESFLDSWLAQRGAAREAVSRSGTDGSARRREFSRVAAVLRAPVLRAAAAQRRLLRGRQEARGQRRPSPSEPAPSPVVPTLGPLIADLSLERLSHADRHSFYGAYHEELELRVGSAITEQLTDEQLNEFEEIIDGPDDDERAQAWLSANVPEHKAVVRREERALRWETRVALHRMRG